VTVVGLGAVGSYAVEGLARCGVGRLRIVDFDKIQKTNLNRHLWALSSTLGEPKAKLGRKRVLDINPKCKVEALGLFAMEDSFDTFLDEPPDLLVDAIDSLNPKIRLLKACDQRGIRVVSAMGAALCTNPFSIARAPLYQTRGCPLAYRVRKRLRKESLSREILCVYSPEKRRDRFTGPTSEDRILDRGRTRNKLGSLSTVTGAFGLALAHCAIEILCGGFDSK